MKSIDKLKKLLQDYIEECDKAKVAPQFFMEYVCNKRYKSLLQASILLGFVTTSELRRVIQILQQKLPN